MIAATIPQEQVSTVASEAGSDIMRLLHNLAEQQRTSSTASDSERLLLESQLYALFSECNVAGWDDEGALPVSVATFANARRFVRALPIGLPTPGVSCSPDGSFEFDWMPMRGRVLAVGVHPTNRLSVAWLNGNDRGHAVMRFDGVELPLQLVQLIKAINGSRNA